MRLSLVTIALFAGFMLAGGVLFAPSSACAAFPELTEETDLTHPEGACDVSVYNTIVNRAYLQAQQDTLVNAAVIRKPDSVLEYSCFDESVSEIAVRSTQLFSESDRWAPDIVDVNQDTPARPLDLVLLWQVPYPVTYVAGFDPTSIDGPLQDLVLETVASYLGTSPDGNFGHDYLGGGASEDYTTSTVISPGYNCSQMNAAWQAAKCEGMRRAYSFDDLVGEDPRRLPYAPGCAASEIDTATIEASSTKFDPETLDDPEFPGESDSDTYASVTEPKNCDANVPVPTGLRLVDKEYDPELYENVSTPYMEHFCSNPGCYYNYETERCEN